MNADFDAGRLPVKLSQKVGAQLRERRAELSRTLRQVAEAADISAAHLSDVEKGRTHPSLPVLLRIGKALDLPLAQLLPSLGGHHARSGTVLTDQPQAVLSDSNLQLRATAVNVDPDLPYHLDVAPGEDVLIFIVSGSCTVEIDGTAYQAARRDCLDVERSRTVRLTAASRCSALVCRGPRPSPGR